MATTLFISPHLDDVVFSCAAAVRRVVARGDHAVIVTVFSHGGNHAMRRGEDRQAAAQLGAEVVWLGFDDAPDRNHFHRDFESIIFGRAAEDQALPSAIARAIQQTLVQHLPGVIYAPLAVGTHIDHRLCFEAMQLVQSDAPRWYEDRPYSYAEGAVELRLRELGFDAGPIDRNRLLADFRRLPHVRTFLPPGPSRRHCESLLLKPLHREPAQAVPQAKVIRCDTAETRAAHDAAAAYRSQFASFCASRRSLQQRDARHARRLGFCCPRAERYWTLPLNPSLYSHENPAPH